MLLEWFLLCFGLVGWLVGFFVFVGFFLCTVAKQRSVSLQVCLRIKLWVSYINGKKIPHKIGIFITKLCVLR